MKNIIYLSLVTILFITSCKKEKETIQLTEEQGRELIKVVTEKDWGGIKNEILLAIDIYEGLLECGITGDSSDIVINHMTDSLSYIKDFNYDWEYFLCDNNPSTPEFIFIYRLDKNSNTKFENEAFSYSITNECNYSVKIYDGDDPDHYKLRLGGGIGGIYKNLEFTQSQVNVVFLCPMNNNDFISINKTTKAFETHICPFQIYFPTIDNRFSYRYELKIN